MSKKRFCDLVEVIVKEILAWCEEPTVVWTVGPVGELDALMKEPPMATAQVLKAGQFTHLSFSVKDDKGKPAAIDGKPTWNMVEPVTDGPWKLIVADDGMSADLQCPDDPASLGVGKVMIDCDADLGSGVRDIQDSMDVTCIPRDAQTVTILADPPQDLP